MIKMKYKFKKALFKQAQIVDVYMKSYAQDSSSSEDCNIFMMQVLPKNYRNEPDYQFSHIATPVDMEEYPSEYTRQKAYYRADNACIRVGCIEHAVDFIKYEQGILNQLNLALAVLDQSDSESWSTQPL